MKKNKSVKGVKIEEPQDKQVSLRMVIQSILEEPEYPDPMPDKMWTALKNDRDLTTQVLRTTVKLTKRGILNRILRDMP